MKKFFGTILFALTICLTAQTIKSPDGNLTLKFQLTNTGQPQYELMFGTKYVIKPSRLGIELKNQNSFVEGFSIAKVDTSSFDNTWQPVWGEAKEIRNNYKELAVTLSQSDKKEIVIRFRLFNDGFGFRFRYGLHGDVGKKPKWINENAEGKTETRPKHAGHEGHEDDLTHDSLS